MALELDPRRAAVTLRQRARATRARALRLGAPRYQPTAAQWEVLLVLADGARLPAGGCTTLGAHVARPAADALVVAELAVKGEDGRYYLTEHGARRANARL